MEPSPVRIEELLAHAGWVRRLAARLVADPNAADDVAQEVWAYALRSPPRNLRNVRGWLSAVVHNAARSLGRADTRRGAREAAVVRTEDAPAADDLVERGELHRRLVEQVMALEEPYRSIVLARWFEGESIAQVARRQGVTARVAKARLDAAHAQLRQDLDRAAGGREVWSVAFVNWIAPRPFAGTTAGIGGVLLSSKVVLSGLGGVVVLVLLLLGRSAWNGKRALTSEAEAARQTAAPRETTRQPPSEPTERTAIPDAGAGAEAATAVTATGSPRELAHVSGTVLDTDGQAHAMLLVGNIEHPDEALAWTAADGSYELSVPVGACLSAHGKGFTTVLEHSVLALDERHAEILVAPRVDIGGTVLDSRSAPVEGARLWVHFDTANLARAPISFETARPIMRGARTDAQGHFALDGIPGGAAIRLNVQHPDFDELSVRVPAQSTADLILHMDPGEAITHELSGLVVHSDGSAAPGSCVRLGENNQTWTREDGRFDLFVRSDFERADLIAFLAGFQPAILPAFGSSLTRSTNPHPELRLVLGPAALAIEGTVDDADGHGLAGWVVSLASGTEVSLHQLPPEFVESFAEPSNARVRSDAAGHFRIGGLRGMSYVLRAYDPASLVCVDSEPIAAGARDQHLTVPRDCIWESIQGSVMARDGSPVSGVRLTVMVVRRFSTGIAPLRGRSVLSDASGAFSLEQVPRRSLALMCEGENILEAVSTITEDSDPRHLSLTVVRTVHFRLARVSPAAKRSDAIRAFTDAGQPAWISLSGGSGGTQVALGDIGASVLTTGEDVRALALYADGKEIARCAVNLALDRVTDCEL